MKRLTSILLCLIMASAPAVLAQKWDLKQGDKEFHAFNFTKAILYYKEAYKKDNSNAYAARRAGDCNRLIHNSEQAEFWYANTLAIDTSEPQDLFYYAQALRSNGKYEQAEEAFKKYLERNPGDIAAFRISSEFDLVNNLSEDMGRYEIRHLMMNTSAMEFAPAFFKEDIIFVSNRDPRGIIEFNDYWSADNFLQLFVGRRDDDGELVDIELFREIDVNGKFHEGPACVDKSTNQLLFTRSNYVRKRPFTSLDDIVNLRIFTTYAGRGTIPDQITEPFAFNSDEYSVCHPAISDEGDVFIYASTEPNGHGESDLYIVHRVDGRWMPPQNMGDVINTNRREMFPFLASDKTLYFASEGHVGLGGLDIYRCDYVNGGWSRPVNMGAPINSPSDDFSFIFKKDERFGYFTSNRLSGYEDDDIYYFEQKVPDKCIIAGIARDKDNGDVLPGSEIALFSADGELIEMGVADKNGAYSFAVDPGGSFMLKGTKNEYLDGDNSVSLDDRCDLIREAGEEELMASLNSAGELEVNLMLDKQPPFTLLGIITDKDDGHLLNEVLVNVTDNATGEVLISEMTGENGEYRKFLEGKKLRDVINYRIELMKNGYLPRSYDLVKVLTHPGEHRTEAQLQRVEVGLNLADVIDINPIYFDLDKYNIRQDAATELDKIAEIMRLYPEMEIELSSHTDSRASHAYNMVLSGRRARSSKAYLVDKGITDNRIFGKGYGETQLSNGCYDGILCPEEDHQLNRRTEFIIVKL